MKILLLVIGRPGLLLRAPIAEYERRAARYWTLQTVELKEEKAVRGLNEEQVREIETERLLHKAPAGFELIALNRTGDPWSSSRLASYLQQLAVRSKPGAAFLIGGAYGLTRNATERAQHQLSLSAMTLTHELARLVLAEQLYRAGTIMRNEPYHKARE